MSVRVRGLRSLAVVCALLPSPTSRAEAPWEGFPPATPESWNLPEADLYDVAANDGRAWAVGYWGTALRSEDGGASWSPGATPTTRTLFSVDFADASHGWAVGAYGVILRSTDGGKTWNAQSAELVDDYGTRPLDSHLMGVSAVGANEAWAVGDFGAVLHTTDGKTWETIRIAEETYTDDNLPDRIFNAVEFLDAQRGWIAGEFGTVLRTTDGGATWAADVTLGDEASDLYLYSIAARDPNRVTVSGLAGRVLFSEDGGRTFVSRPLGSSVGVFGIAVRGERTVAVGDRGVVFVSGDDGVQWTDPERPHQFNWMTSAAFGDANVGVAVGENGFIARTTDGGRKWAHVAGHEPPPASGVSVPEGTGPEPLHRSDDAQE